MIDTVKLLFPEGQYTLMKPNEWRLSTVKYGVRRSIRNPSSSELKSGLYLPTLTLTQRPTRQGRQETLALQFSAPKLLYGNNFDELTDDDFATVIIRLLSALKRMGVIVPSELLVNGKVVGWHPSKNIVLHEHFASQTIINTLQKADISQTYRPQKTDFTDGEILHYHCNSKDIAVYDKLADLRRSKVSDKRAFEPHNQVQHELLDMLASISPLSILRFELRFNSAAAIRRVVQSTLGSASPTFEQVFSSQLARHVLLQHWQQLTKDIDYLSLDSGKPLDVLQNYLAECADTPPTAALAAVTALLVANQAGVRPLRQTLDARFGRHYWPRLKPLMRGLQPRRLQHIQQAQAALEQFEPVDKNSLTIV